MFSWHILYIHAEITNCRTHTNSLVMALCMISTNILVLQVENLVGMSACHRENMWYTRKHRKSICTIPCHVSLTILLLHVHHLFATVGTLSGFGMCKHNSESSFFPRDHIEFVWPAFEEVPQSTKMAQI